ncbi:VOC family protein [Weissella cibaria]|uniref:VOC family protein n=1 Tax=Weissella cibaria TaxID=137591 RepID=UPI0018A05B62|nr:VOC family protein [Weissella cibaria]
MNNDVEVMLYVTDVEREAKFWQSVGFVERDRQDMGTTEMVQMAPSEDGAFAFNIFDLAFIKENSPEVADNVPSVMLYSDDIETLYEKMQSLGIETGELVEMGLQKVFNFANPDGLYFGVSGI